MQPAALKRRPRVLAGRRLARSLPARTRARRWLQLIFKDHYSSLRGAFASFQGVATRHEGSSERVLCRRLSNLRMTWLMNHSMTTTRLDYQAFRRLDNLRSVDRETANL